MFFAPVASATLFSVAPEEHGQASGAATAIRELAVVLAVAGGTAGPVRRVRGPGTAGSLAACPPAGISR